MHHHGHAAGGGTLFSLGIILAMAVGHAGNVPAIAQVGQPAVVYQSRYDDPANLALWSKPQTDKTKRLMLGRFHTATESLSLKALPAHRFVRLKAQLFIMDSWDGSNPGDGPDQIAVRVGDGRTLLRATFSPYGKDDSRVTIPPTQSFPDNYGTGNYPGLTGCDAHDVDWLPRSTESWGANAVYTLDYTFPHSAADLRIDFIASLLDSDPTIKNESWGLGHVEVSVLPDSPVQLDLPQVTRLVAQLDAEDPLIAHRAIGTLISAGDSSVDVIRRALAALAPPSSKRVVELIRQLDAEQFAVREAAQRELEAAGPDVLADSTNALQAGVPVETESRLQQILAKGKTRPWTLRQQRLARVLDAIGGEKALALRVTFNTAAPLPDMETIRQRLKVTDNEWQVLSVKISQVVVLLNDPGYAMAYQETANRTAAMAEMQKLRTLLESPTTDTTLKIAMTAVRDQRLKASFPVDPTLQRNLVTARNNLKQLITIRQEAILLAMNILD